MLAHQIDNILVVPVIQRTLCDLIVSFMSSRGQLTNLEMLTVDTPRQLLEERLHNFRKFRSVDNIHNLLDLIEEHDFLWWIDFRPIPQQTKENLFCQTSILLEELYHTISELRMV
jgi:hypothetical protein